MSSWRKYLVQSVVFSEQRVSGTAVKARWQSGLADVGACQVAIVRRHAPFPRPSLENVKVMTVLPRGNLAAKDDSDGVDVRSLFSEVGREKLIQSGTDLMQMQPSFRAAARRNFILN